MKKALACVALGLVASVTTVAGDASAERQAKTSICHLDAGSNSFKLISVASPAVAAHVAHGDGMPGGPVPGMDGFEFGQTCEAIPAATAVCMGGGFANLARAATWWIEFSSQQECVDHVAAGGVVVADLDPAVTLEITDRFEFNPEGNCAFQVTGTGFLPNVIFSIGLIHQGSLTQFAGGFADATGTFVRSYDGIFVPQFTVGQTVQVRITENVDGNPPVIVMSDVVECTSAS